MSSSYKRQWHQNIGHILYKTCPAQLQLPSREGTQPKASCFVSLADTTGEHTLVVVDEGTKLDITNSELEGVIGELPYFP